MTTMNPAAAAARESSRTLSGQFGTQPKGEAELDLSPIGPAPVDAALTALPMAFRRGARDSTHQEYIVLGAGPNVRRLTTVRDEHGDFVQVERAFDLDNITDRCIGEDHPDSYAWLRTRHKDIEDVVASHDPGFGQRLSYYHGESIEAESVDPSVRSGGVNEALTAAAARAGVIPVEDIIVAGLQQRTAADTAAGRELAGEHVTTLTDAQAEVAGRAQRILAARTETLSVTAGGQGDASLASITWSSRFDPSTVHTDEIDAEGFVVRSTYRHGDEEDESVRSLDPDIAPKRRR